jgi:hypothetical protein
VPDPANILTSVTATNDGCTGDVTLTFRPNHNRPPSCGAKYAPGPFTEDASGKAVTVSGNAFLVVRCEPARSYDPLSGATTYRAPASKHIPISGTGPVQDMASTGDFEGVMSWVVGVDKQRPFTAGETIGGVFMVTIV